MAVNIFRLCYLYYNKNMNENKEQYFRTFLAWFQGLSYITNITNIIGTIFVSGFCFFGTYYGHLQTNKEILEKIQPEDSLEAMIIKLRLGYVGHVLRKPTSMENSIMLGKTEGTRRRGRPRTRWMDGVKEAVGMKLGQLKEVVKDRKLWRKVIMEVTRSRTRIDGT